MSEPFLGEIRIFAGNFAPRGWAFCNGQLLPVAQNTALFSLFGTTYGGDGRTTFGVPNVAGRQVMHAGGGPGLSPRRLGEQVGAPTVTLTDQQTAAHSHGAVASGERAATDNPAGAFPATLRDDGYSGAAADATMPADTAGQTGGGQAHDNAQPYLALNYIVALVGVYPSRS